MSRRTALTLALFVATFPVVFVVVRALWLAYVRTLTESQLHLRVFDHSTAVAIALWTLIFVVTAIVARVGAGVLTRVRDVDRR